MDLRDLHDSVQMSQVIEALDPDKKWDVEELDSQWQRELKDLAASV